MEAKEKLTKDLALKYVEDIKRVIDDDEAAHSLEDDLKDHFISSLAQNHYTKKESIEIAKIIEKVNDMPFARWHA